MNYRPFDTRFTYFTGRSKGFHCMPRGEVMKHLANKNNLALIIPKQTRDELGGFISKYIGGHKMFSAYDVNYFSLSTSTPKAATYSPQAPAYRT